MASRPPPRTCQRRIRTLAFLFAVAVPANAQPATPGGLAATAGDEEAVLTWNDPSNPDVNGYEFRFHAGDAAFNAWAGVPGAGANTVAHTVPGLANGTRYFFELRAFDDDGAGAASSASTRLAESPSSAVEVPDAQLRWVIRYALGLTSDAPITQGAMARLRWLRAEEYGIADLAGLEFAINLERLSLPDNQIADISTLSGLTTLTDLDLSYNNIADTSPVSGLATLTGLDLHGNAIADVSPLSRLTALRWLDLSYNEIADLSPLSALVALTRLDLAGNEIGDVARLSSLTSLARLDLSNNEIADVSLSGLTALAWLDLSYNEMVDVSLSGLTALAWLDLSYNKMPDVSALSGLQSLTHLILNHNEIADVSALSGLPSLTRLILSHNKMADVSLSGLTALVELHLNNNAIADVSGLSGLPALERLFLHNNEIVDMSPLVALRRLTWLRLGNNEMEEVVLSGALARLETFELHGNAIWRVSLSSLPRLRNLDLHNNKIEDISLVGLRRLTWLDLHDNEIEGISLVGLGRLTWLDLHNNKMSDVSPLSDLTVLTWLDLRNNAIADVSPLSGLAALRNLDLAGNAMVDVSLSDLPALMWLGLSNNEIESISLSGLTALVFPDLSSLTSLTTLELQHYEMRDVAMLFGLDSLTRLTLNHNKIADVSALSGLTALVELRLNSNEISNVSALSDLTSLKTLELDDNEVVNVSALSGLQSLTRLILSHNEIADVAALSELTALTTLHLEDNAISDVAPLSRLRALRELRLNNNDIADVVPLSGLTALQALYLHGNSIEDVAPLSSLTALTTLALSGNAIVDVSPLSGLRALTGLWLYNNEIEHVSLSGLTALTTLALSGNAIASVSLSGLTSLKSLWLCDNEIADVSGLSGLTALGRLRVCNNAIADVSPLSGLAALAELRLDGNAVSDASPLADLEGLRFLTLGGNAVADISPLLESALPGPKSYVDLRGNPLREEQTAHIVALRELGTAVEYDDGGHRVPLFPSAAPSATMPASSAIGFARVINHANEAGSVTVEAVDEMGERRGPVSLAIGAGQALHFDAEDLERGSAAKGLRGIGEGAGDWRLVLRSALDIEVLGYARTPDGFVTSLHDLAAEAHAESQVPTFNPGSDQRQASGLRLTNPTASEKRASVRAWDDAGSSLTSSLVTPAHRMLNLTATQLESGQGAGDDSAGFTGIGDGAGRWRLRVHAPGQRVMSLLRSPAGHLANISTGTAALRNERGYHAWARGGRYQVPLFLATSSAVQGFLRIVNLHGVSATVTLRAYDSVGVAREPVVMTVKGYHVLHLSADELESGSAAKDLPGIGAGTGDWHLEVSADERFEVLAYARTADGFLTSLHDIAPRAEDGSLWIPFFNPGSNRAQASRLRLVNWGDMTAKATITGIDDAGESGGAVRVTLPAHSARDYMAWELETGDGAGLSGTLGDGTGRWRLRVSAPVDVAAMSLLSLPTGHVTNLSTTPRYPRQYGRSRIE